MLLVCRQPNELTSPKFCEAFAQGCGGEVSDTYQGGDWSGFASPDNWDDVQRAKQDGFDFYYGDHGYFGRRQFYRITKNDYQHDGNGHSDCSRLSYFGIDIKPWHQGDYVIICPQSEEFMRLHGINRSDWIDDCINEIRKHTDRKIFIRNKRDLKPLQRVLDRAYCIVTYSSNIAVDAILSGVPAICLGKCAASKMSVDSISKINDLYRPENRLEWAGVLADNQWTLPEIRNGDAWRKLNV